MKTKLLNSLLLTMFLVNCAPPEHNLPPEMEKIRLSIRNELVQKYKVEPIALDVFVHLADPHDYCSTESSIACQIDSPKGSFIIIDERFLETKKIATYNFCQVLYHEMMHIVKESLTGDGDKKHTDVLGFYTDPYHFCKNLSLSGN